MRIHSVAIDGPSGAGKSTLARRAAQELGYLYVDTGAIYRSIGWYILRMGVDPSDADAVSALLSSLHIRLYYDAEGLQHMEVNGHDVTDAIRHPDVSAATSKVSAIAAVRAYLLEMQRDLARRSSVIMDGRDIGTIVLPDADCKIFLTASDTVRAQRRCIDLEQRGTPRPYDEVLSDMRLRDEQDRTRKTAPLVKADDAVLLDTSDMDFEQSVQALIALIKEKIGYEA